jgi:hypothetical protein
MKLLSIMLIILFAIVATLALEWLLEPIIDFILSPLP